jgi:prepilin peptidase CpaA
MTYPVPHLLPLGLGVGAAVVDDLRRRKVPNWISGLVALSGLTTRFIDQGPVAALAGMGVAVLVIAALCRAWQAGGVGGGDVKLAAAVAVWMVGWTQIIAFVLVGAVAGGVVSLACYVLARRSVREDIRTNLTLAFLQHELPTAPTHKDGRVVVPYALAIAAGASVLAFVR